jgi:hypothetical protein
MLMDISYSQSGHVLLEKINSFDHTVIYLSSARFVVAILTRSIKIKIKIMNTTLHIHCMYIVLIARYWKS